MNALERRFSFVTGKGGVGKTTVSASLAVSLSASGRRTLLAVTDPEPYRALVPEARWQEDPTPARAGLWTVHLRPDLALKEYGRLLIKPRLARQALFENRYVQGFLAAVPGLPEWAVLGKAWYHASEKLGGAPRFDHVIFDAPASGHGLEMLRLPQVIMEVAPAGLLRRDAELARAMLQDPNECSIVIVTLPEELPTNEAIELRAELLSELGLPVGALVLNRLRSLVFEERERTLLRPLWNAQVSGEAAPALSAAAAQAAAEMAQLESRARLAVLGTPLIELPQLEHSVLDPSWLSDLGRLLLSGGPSRDRQSPPV